MIYLEPLVLKSFKIIYAYFIKMAGSWQKSVFIMRVMSLIYMTFID
jgi:hypothetical protein